MLCGLECESDENVDAGAIILCDYCYPAYGPFVERIAELRVTVEMAQKLIEKQDREIERLRSKVGWSH